MSVGGTRRAPCLEPCCLHLGPLHKTTPLTLECYLRSSSLLENHRTNSVSFTKIPRRHQQGRAVPIGRWQKRDLSVQEIPRGCGPRVSMPSHALPMFVDAFRV